ncbi:OmpA/MotB domain protein [Psychromonas ingrahamii 37]|uniref:OmpA/MotB domain protein n=1 Tax=Psychromonas ingrahamii (strain DSM 17664 / CCUG 51855 / 37) TaxID=357804 RepID=A1T0J7_PSYIN|nr:OmpA family protein [Psychromonas ingrahamii]ABM05262.1 OmpA/MotB domain protein [Psychromonas ingrahamii 37]
MYDKKQQIIIIKKGRHQAHEEHSSAWKLAFADLMVSLMCVFLVLWALQIADKKEKEDIIHYFRTGQMSTPQERMFAQKNSLVSIPLMSSAKDNNTDINDTVNNALIQGEYNTQEELQFLMKRLDDLVEEIDASNNILIEVIPDGLRILLTASEDQKMYERGGTQLTPFYEDMLLEFSSVFNAIENGVVITGHTDSAPYNGQQVSNWELSSQRANSARRIMELGGLKKANITQVIGMANTKPIDKQNELSSINRRVEVIILTRQAVDDMNDIYGGSDEQYSKLLAKKDNATTLASKNKPVTRLDFAD